MAPAASVCDRETGTIAAVLATTLVLASLFFHFSPGLDLAVAGAFFDPANPAGPFPESADPALLALRQVGLKLPPLAMVLLGAVVLARLVRPAWRRPVATRDALWLLATAALANGLVVNLILKEHWGRARPHQTLEFGGAGPFTSAWTMSAACETNCSFVSGEAANAFWMLAALCLVPKGLRAPVGGVIAVLAGTIAFNRVAVGGHYLSDVVISGLIVLTVAAILRLFFRPGGLAAGNGRLRQLLGAGYSVAPDA